MDKIDIRSIVLLALGDRNSMYRLGLTADQIQEVALDAVKSTLITSQPSREAMIVMIEDHLRSAIDRLSPTMRRQKAREAMAKRLKIRLAMRDGRHHHFAA